jgi:hypothetical protein
MHEHLHTKLQSRLSANDAVPTIFQLTLETQKYENFQRPNVLNPSSHGPCFPHHVTASGHIEPGISGHIRPGHETVYPFSPPPPPQFLQGPQNSLYDMISFNIAYVACQVVNYIWEYIYFFDMLKETFQFWALSLPPQTGYYYKELHEPGQNWWA